MHGSVKFQFPIRKLPVTLGREHSHGMDQNFIGLGKEKNLSRKQCKISFMYTDGSSVGNYDEDDPNLLVYKPPDSDILPVFSGSKSPPSSNGFFAIECLGKNTMVVGGKTYRNGETVALQNGTPIKLGVFHFYFILPVEERLGTIERPNPEYESYLKRAANAMNANEADSKDHNPNKKQRVYTCTSSTPPPPTLPSNVTPRDKPRQQLSLSSKATDLESLPLEELMAKMTEAIQADQWDRRHQILGGAISCNAVRDAAQSPEILKLAAQDENNAVTRADIIQWIHNSPTYNTWAMQMLSKMETKSYQSSIGKALTRAGYGRTGTGRSSKWSLPKNTGLSPRFKSPLSTEKGNRVTLDEQDNDGYNDEDEDDEDDGEESDEASDNELPSTDIVTQPQAQSSGNSSSSDNDSESDSDQNNDDEDEDSRSNNKERSAECDDNSIINISDGDESDVDNINTNDYSRYENSSPQSIGSFG